MIDGVVDIDDYDVFRFHADKGQTVIFDVLSTRAGTRFDSTLTVLDERGAELDFVDDLMGQSFQMRNPNAVASCGWSGGRIWQA